MLPNNQNLKDMKRILFIMAYVLLAIGLAGCSKDDDSNDGNNAIKVIYHVLDKNGQETSVFNYGDEIRFELIIMNSTSHTLKYADELDFIKGAFIVYGSDGQMFNPIPTSDLLIHPVTIEPDDQFKSRLIWPWNLVPLPAGKYHSTCTLDIEELSNKTYTINFVVK